MVKRFTPLRNTASNLSNQNNLPYLIIFVLISYITFLLFYKTKPESNSRIDMKQSITTGYKDRFNDPYIPPLKDNLYLRSNKFHISSNLDIRGDIDINSYSQVGILTNDESDKHPLILPLFGKRIMNGRNNFNYYTLSNSGTVNTKLPLKKKGKSCTSEYGCDELNDKDEIYVQGYEKTFRVTIYENNSYSYMM